MFVIKRNGTTKVYTGWRAWLGIGLSVVAAWAILALTAAVFIGVAVTVGLLLLLLIPAAILVLLISSVMGRRP